MPKKGEPSWEPGPEVPPNERWGLDTPRILPVWAARDLCRLVEGTLLPLLHELTVRAAETGSLAEAQRLASALEHADKVFVETFKRHPQYVARSRLTGRLNSPPKEGH